MGFPAGSGGKKNLPTMQETLVQPLDREVPLKGMPTPTPVFFLGESHEQRSLMGYSPWGHKESDMTGDKCSSNSDHSPLAQILRSIMTSSLENMMPWTCYDNKERLPTSLIRKGLLLYLQV